jgi:PAS domain S-box-containing protein
LLSSIVECSDDAIISKDLDGMVLSWNQGAERIYGYSPEEMVGQPISQLVPPDHPDEFPEIMEYIRLGQKIEHLETERIRKDGKRIFVALTISPLRDDSGKIVGASAIGRDITGRKLAAKALERSELRYRSLIRAISQIVWTTNDQGEVVEDVPTWREFTGRSFEELKGWGRMQALHPDDRERTMEVWKRALKKASIYTTVYRLRRSDGEYRWMSVNGVPVLDESGKVQEWVGTCADITDRVLAEEEVSQLNLTLEKRVVERTAELQAANKELEAFAYSVSHDLRAPLRAVDGFSRILLEEYAPQLPAEAQRYLRVVQENAVQMGNLIDGLLAFSRLGRQPLSKQPVAPNELVRQSLADLAAEQDGRQIEISVAELPACQGDPLLLKQVFLNLALNAFRAMPPGGTLRLRLGWAPQYPGGLVRVEVQDEGRGIAPELLEKIYEPGFTTTPGSPGLGLAVCKKIVEQHTGAIEVQSKPTEGTRFAIVLPVIGDEA